MVNIDFFFSKVTRNNKRKKKNHRVYFRLVHSVDLKFLRSFMHDKIFLFCTSQAGIIRHNGRRRSDRCFRSKAPREGLFLPPLFTPPQCLRFPSCQLPAFYPEGPPTVINAKLLDTRRILALQRSRGVCVQAVTTARTNTPHDRRMGILK